MLGRRSFVFGGLLTVTLAACGCGGGDSVKLAPVEGVVKLKGQPLKNAALTFYPENGPAGVATVGEDGKFRVKTNGSTGAVVGKHKVTVSQGDADNKIPAMDGKEIQAVKKATLPKKYLDQKTTDLVVDVPAGGLKDLAWDLDEK